MSLTQRLRSKFRGWVDAHANGSQMHFNHELMRELRVTNDLLRIAIVELTRTSNPLNEFGAKVFSQSDEDGITLEILRRLGIDPGIALEIGSGDGTENNTLVLLASGWKCAWVDLVSPSFDPELDRERLRFIKNRISLENLDEVLSAIGDDWWKSVNVLSVDVDGMEGYLTTGLLDRGISPEVIIVEVNRIFPPPIVYRQPYDSMYTWDHSINCGWSLQAFVDELTSYGYKLVACNGHTGVNAFFVQAKYADLFSEVPNDSRKVFVGRGMKHIKSAYHGLVADKNSVSEILKSTR